MASSQPFNKAILTILGISLSLTTGACGGGSYISKLQDKGDVEQLVTIYEKRDEQSLEAAQALGTLGDPAAVESLLTGLQDSDPKIQEVSIEALGKIQAPQAVEPLIATYNTGSTEIQTKVKESLQAIASGIGNDPQLVDPLKAQLETGTPNEKVLSLQVLRKVADADYTDSFLKAAQDQDGNVRAIAVAALGDNPTNPQAIEVFLNTLKNDDDLNARIIASGAIKESGDARAIPALIAALNDPEIRVQRMSVLGLSILKAPEGVAPLTPFLKSEDEDLKQTTIEAFTNIGTPSAIKGLIGEFNQNSPAVQDALTKIGTPAVPELISALDNQSPPIKAQAAIVLGNIKDERAISPLVNKLTDVTCNRAVAQALSQLSWQPESDRDRIHFLVAQRNGGTLNQEWETTKTVLLQDIDSGNRRDVQNALYAFISLGNEEILTTLMERVRQTRSKETAEVFLNCGHPDLEQAAKDWAKNNGYIVENLPDAAKPDIQWGGW